nr:hypothetical protein [Citrobacter braakii]
MATTITEITECFEYFFSSLYRREFVKTLRLNKCNERELLPLVRCYLLGWFADNVSPEVKSKLPGTVSGHGYIDFVIDDVAVEFAVRQPTAARSNVSATGPLSVGGITVNQLSMWSIFLWENADRWHWGKSPKTSVSLSRELINEQKIVGLIDDSHNATCRSSTICKTRSGSNPESWKGQC